MEKWSNENKEENEKKRSKQLNRARVQGSHETTSKSLKTKKMWWATYFFLENVRKNLEESSDNTSRRVHFTENKMEWLSWGK